MGSRSISALRRVSRDDLPGSPDWMDTLLGVQNEFQEQAVSRLGELTRGKHYVTNADFVHGEQTRVRSPLPPGVRPRAVIAVASQGVRIGADGRPTGEVYPLAVDHIDWQPLQSDPRQAAQLGITVNFDLRHTEPTLTRYRTATAALTHNTQVLIGFDTVERHRRSDVISYSAGVFTLHEPGEYIVVHKAQIQNATDYHFYQFRIEQDGTTTLAEQLIPPQQPSGTGGANPRATMTAKVDAVAGTTIRCYARHLNVAANDRNIEIPTRCSIHRLFNASTPTGRVTLHIFGDR